LGMFAFSYKCLAMPIVKSVMFLISINLGSSS
jgi:hypothetical protein